MFVIIKIIDTLFSSSIRVNQVMLVTVVVINEIVTVGYATLNQFLFVIVEITSGGLTLKSI